MSEVKDGDLDVTHQTVPNQITASMAREIAFQYGAVLSKDECELFAEGWNICRENMLRLQR